MKLSVKLLTLFLTLFSIQQRAMANPAAQIINFDSSDELMASVCDSQARTAALAELKVSDVVKDDLYVDAVSIIKTSDTAMSVEVFIKSMDRPTESPISFSYFCHKCMSRSIEPIILSNDADTKLACSTSSGEIL